MKYYVRRDASSEIEGPFDLPAIRGWIAGGRFTNDFEAIQDTGRTAEELKACRDWQSLGDVFAQPEARQRGESADAFLGRVRKNSCYRTLRLFIDLTMVAAWGGGAAAIYLNFQTEEQGLRTGTLLIAAALILVASVGLVAIRQSAVLFVDIADILIEQNRRK